MQNTNLEQEQPNSTVDGWGSALLSERCYNELLRNCLLSEFQS